MAKTPSSRRHRSLIDLLIQYREVVGMTQAELAARLGQYQSFVARIESGQRRIDVVEFLELSEILGFDAAEAVEAIKLGKTLKARK